MLPREAYFIAEFRDTRKIMQMSATIAALKCERRPDAITEVIAATGKTFNKLKTRFIDV